MRLDKYLKVSRLIKRRTVANEACDAGRVFVNGKPAARLTMSRWAMCWKCSSARARSKRASSRCRSMPERRKRASFMSSSAEQAYEFPFSRIECGEDLAARRMPRGEEERRGFEWRKRKNRAAFPQRRAGKQEGFHRNRVSDVDSFDDQTIVAYTDLGELVVRGHGLHINRLNMETGSSPSQVR